MNKEMKGGAGKTRTLLLSIFLFLCIYAPPILPDINLILVIAVLSIPYLLLHSRTCLRVLSSSPAKSFIAWFASFVCYWLVITFLNVLLGEGGFGADYTTSAYSFFLVLPVCLICSTAAMVYKENNGLSMGQVIKAFIVAGLIQAAFALAAFFDPGVKSFLTEIMFENTGTEQMQSGLWIADRRFYGFANSMLDLYGLGTGKCIKVLVGNDTCSSCRSSPQRSHGFGRVFRRFSDCFSLCREGKWFVDRCHYVCCRCDIRHCCDFD